MQSNLKELLDKIYELEGLVHLALKREEDSEDFVRLISKKGKEVGGLCQNLLEEDKAIPKMIDKTDSNFDLEEYSLEEDSESIVNSPVLSEILERIEDETQAEDLKITSSDSQKGKLVFSINERFRFKRELFDNSDADFNNTLALVASMETYEEAEEYFINEEGFDPSDPVVKEFMEVIKRYFK